MNIIVDESVDYYFVHQLRNYSFPVVSISERFASTGDESIISLSLFQPSLIITEDKDFGELVLKINIKFTVLFYCVTTKAYGKLSCRGC